MNYLFGYLIFESMEWDSKLMIEEALFDKWHLSFLDESFELYFLTFN